MKIDVMDIEGNTYTETIPKFLPARISNECDATFQDSVRSAGGDEEAQVTNAYQAISHQKQIIVKYLNNNWFENSLGPDRLAQPSQKKIVEKYEDQVEGLQTKKKEKTNEDNEEN